MPGPLLMLFMPVHIILRASRATDPVFLSQGWSWAVSVLGRGGGAVTDGKTCLV